MFVCFLPAHTHACMHTDQSSPPKKVSLSLSVCLSVPKFLCQHTDQQERNSFVFLSFVDLFDMFFAFVETKEMNKFLFGSKKGFEFWKFPHCVGALDGKHIDMFCPPRSGSFFFNWKRRFSIVLLALIDADYKFTMISVGHNSSFGKKLLSGDLNLPPEERIDGAPRHLPKLPYVFVGDEAFPLRNNMMRPYPGAKNRRLPLDEHVFNWRMNIPRKISENAFGIFVQRFRIFHRKILLEPPTAVLVVKTVLSPAQPHHKKASHRHSDQKCSWSSCLSRKLQDPPKPRYTGSSNSKQRSRSFQRLLYVC